MMAYPIPVISQNAPGRTLTDLYLNLERSNPAQDGTPPGLLLTLPTAWANKYQVLLYGAAARHRYAVAGVTTPEDLAHVSWPGPVTLHAHWFSAFFRGAANETEAMNRLDQIREAILRFRDRTGARLIWTAHNVFPHGNAFPETFLALRQWIFDKFDAVHLMNTSHLPILERAFSRTAPRTFTVPHMLYTGAIPDSVNRAAARAHFGLPQDSTVFGYFGSIQGYKQIPLILDAMDAVRSDQPVFALIGGLPTDTRAVRDVQARIGTRQDVIFVPRKMHDHEIQYLHHAADTMALAYAETLNSGAALMAASFRRPFLIPRGSASDGLESLGAQPFDGDDPNSMIASMRRYAEGPTPPHTIDQDVWQARQPDQISQAFFTALARLAQA